ncbi:NAD-dependent oxidoreductase [Myxococcus stipitatus DSM 14675]|uniref:NAD-dependent oxidoreductase n=1 Tax=Myxococcus stipitatus (strain DSM 14675 / JCM 12634 / Mx s8) TaxID=1278073 RepID=L7UIT5_MYXSD|nr:NAD-dependent oxidoreductase [Myxococcus stipitatus]AGC47913.1 NAD-dependent oxidoreductase [Myxococcus stipitatus DSM 14675]
MSAEAAPSRSRKPVEYEVTVDRVRMDTHDTATLFLDFGETPPDYKAGQFINIDPHQFPALGRLSAFLQEQKGRKEPQRSYSMASAPHERHVAITVKDEEFIPGLTRYPPLLSPLLVHGRLTGARIKVLGFMGPYVLPEDVEQRTGHVVHLVAGSGAVPNFGILKDALHRNLKPRHTVLMSNKTWGDVLYREELESLERQYPDRVRLVHTLTRELDESRFSASVRKGRIHQALLEELIPDRDTCLVYACGPAITPWDRRKALETRTPATPRFMETVLGHLHALGIEDKRIRRETYG